MATATTDRRTEQDTSYHDRRLARRLKEDPEFRAEFERQQREIAGIDAIVNKLDALRTQHGLTKADLMHAPCDNEPCRDPASLDGVGQPPVAYADRRRASPHASLRRMPTRRSGRRSMEPRKTLVGRSARGDHVRARSGRGALHLHATHWRRDHRVQRRDEAETVEVVQRWPRRRSEDPTRRCDRCSAYPLCVDLRAIRQRGVGVQSRKTLVAQYLVRRTRQPMDEALLRLRRPQQDAARHAQHGGRQYRVRRDTARPRIPGVERRRASLAIRIAG